MKKLKLNVLQLGAKEVLTREQLKKVLGGNLAGNGTVQPSDACKTGSCSVYDPGTHTYYFGTCGYYGGGGISVCECITSMGFYSPSGGTSHCAV